MVSLKGMVSSLIIAVIGLVIIMTVYGETIDDVADAGNTINDTGYTLSGLFASDALIPLVFLGGGLIAVIGLAFAVVKGRD